MRDLHDAVIPEDCRLHMASEDRWAVFLSACVIYDPPVPGLEKFANAGAGALGLDEYPGTLGKGPRFAMQQSPIVQLRNAEKAERATEDFYMDAIGHLIERLEAEGHDRQQIIADVLNFETPEARERWERWARAQSQNEVRPYIEVGPHTTEQDVRSAFRMLKTAQEGQPDVGRPSRKLLRGAECAILYARCGWTYERIAEH